MTFRPLFPILALLVLSGCTPDAEPALAAFDGRLDRVLVDKSGNLAIPGRFVYRGHKLDEHTGYEETSVDGWLVSDTPDDADYGLATVKSSVAYKMKKNDVTGVDERIPYRTKPVIEAEGWHLVKSTSAPEGFGPPSPELLLSEASGTGPIEINAHFGTGFDGMRGRNAGDYRNRHRRLLPADPYVGPGY